MHYLLLLLAPLALALQQFPFGLEGRLEPPKVAIVGAGPAGTFATFALSHFLPSENAALQSEVHLFERSSHIGGRSTTVQLPVPENSYAELGASIFVDANKNLMKAARVFNLTLQDGHGEDERLDKNPMAVYDGERFVFEASSSKYWDLARLLIRYGRSPLTARKLVRSAVASFLSLYSPGTASKGPFSMQQYADVLGFTPLLEETAFTYYTRNGVSPTFVNELISAATSVNYAQSAFKIHAVGGLVSMAASGASSVKGGNRLIFEEFVKRSPKADVHLDTQVKRLTKISHGGQTRWEVQYTEGGSTTAEIFDAVILAAPFAQTGIEIVGSTAADLIPPIDYVDLHVTIVLTNASAPQACFFNAAWPCEKSAPALVFTALDAYDQGKTATEPIINSLSYLRAFRDGSFAVKIFSRTTLSTEDLATAFGHGNVLWSYEKVWQSYPYLRPIGPDDFAAIVLDEGLYYPSAFEALVSTMETATVSSWNAVAHYVKDHFGVRVNKTWAEWD